MSLNVQVFLFCKSDTRVLQEEEGRRIGWMPVQVTGGGAEDMMGRRRMDLLVLSSEVVRRRRMPVQVTGGGDRVVDAFSLGFVVNWVRSEIY